MNSSGKSIEIARGEVWLCTLDPTVGSEIKKTRPCIMVSPTVLNNRLPTLVVAPLSTGSFETSFRIPVRFDSKSGLVLIDQLRTLDRQRLIKKLGKLDAQTVTAVLSALRRYFTE